MTTAAAALPVAAEDDNGGGDDDEDYSRTVGPKAIQVPASWNGAGTPTTITGRLCWIWIKMIDMSQIHEFIEISPNRPSTHTLNTTDPNKQSFVRATWPAHLQGACSRNEGNNFVPSIGHCQFDSIRAQ